MKKSFLIKIAAVILLGSSGLAVAAEKTKMKSNMDKMKHIEMTTEQRQNMVTSHEKMATCLRSDKSAEDCKKEMKNSCQENMGKENCAMMEEMHGMKGKMKQHSMMDMNMDNTYKNTDKETGSETGKEISK